MSSLATTAQRPSKCATAFIVACASGEWPNPSVCPISCVATSATLQTVQIEQSPQPLLNVTLPLTMRRNVVPFSVRRSSLVQNPPTANVPEQPSGSAISSKGSLKTSRLSSGQPPNGAGSSSP